LLGHKPGTLEHGNVLLDRGGPPLQSAGMLM
jgi:hypothetical protein